MTQGTPAEQNFTLVPAATAGLSPEQKEVQEAAGSAIEALRAGRDDEAIQKLNDVIVKLPTCSDCYYNLGLAYTHKQQWPEAEAALKKSIELKPTNPDPYNGLANVYNAQKKFDDALAMNQKASELSATTGGAGGGNAESIYNQGVVLFNAGKYAEAKVQFDAATKADPNNANAFYQLGMTSLNLGQIPDAVAALQTFVKLAPERSEGCAGAELVARAAADAAEITVVLHRRPAGRNPRAHRRRGPVRRPGSLLGPARRRLQNLPNRLHSRRLRGRPARLWRESRPGGPTEDRVCDRPRDQVASPRPPADEQGPESGAGVCRDPLGRQHRTR